MPTRSTFADEPKPEPLAGTEPLVMEGDIASQLVDGVDKFLLRKIDESVEKRERHWKRDFSSAEAYNKSIEPNRKRLADILGIRDARVPFDAPELVATTKQSALVGKGENYEIYAIRWPVLADPDPNRSDVIVYGEGLLCVPTGDKKPIADVIAIPDADQTPEQIVGLAEGVPPESQFARRLAKAGCRVVIPTLISRELKQRNGRATLTNREYLYRGGFEVGRHLIGYEVQKVLALVDWFERDHLAAGENTGGNAASTKKEPEPRIGVIGYGEGGMIALYSTALDTRINATCVSGFVGEVRELRFWRQPIDRNVFDFFVQFTDQDLITMVAPRRLIVDIATSPRVNLPGNGGAPAEIVSPSNDVAAALLLHFVDEALNGFKAASRFWSLHGDVTNRSRFCGDSALTEFVRTCASNEKLAMSPSKAVINTRRTDPPARQSRQIAEIDRHTQLVLRESPYVRERYMKRLYDATDTKDLAAYEKVADEYREKFYNDVIGRFDDPLLPANPRTRKAYDKEKWTGYEVVLDVFPDVIAYGVLLVPKDIKPGKKRPVVVCQHGLEGRPQDVIEGNKDAYHDFAAKLCERGFITFAPQNLYIFGDRFRSLQRKANPLGKTLFSVIVPQHQQITDWLKTLPMVDGERIGFYGLSYGGKSAMRIPPLVKNYCLSICSADFNEWVDKNASTRDPHSYVWSNEYEIFEWDLGSTFNYAEMAALIAPRPFMVERGHFDGVGSDENVAHEFAKVRHHYAARLGIGDRCEIEWFVGPHTINGQGTFKFLHKHLKWPEPGPE
ncbi:MAG: hypothetical protein WD875_18840 [Pirellulales bacterium]